MRNYVVSKICMKERMQICGCVVSKWSHLASTTPDKDLNLFLEACSKNISPLDVALNYTTSTLHDTLLYPYSMYSDITQ